MTHEAEKIEHYPQAGYKCLVIWVDDRDSILDEYPRVKEWIEGMLNRVQA
jgi:hypothetical protein